MRIFLTLLGNDGKALKAWFSTQTISKMLVFSGFMGVFATVVYFLFTGASFFFKSLSPLQSYGLLTANYIIKAAVLLVFILGVGSSIATAISLFFSHNKIYLYLMSLPIKTGEIINWQFIKAVIFNAVFLAVFLLPLFLAFGSYFGGINLIFIFEALLIIVSLAVITISLGGTIALLIIKAVKKLNVIVNLFGVAVFFLIIAAVFNLIFPINIELLTGASNRDFFPIYNSLPLTNLLIPTNWLAMVLTGDPTAILLTAVFTVIPVILYLDLMEKHFLREIQEMSARGISPEFIKNQKPASRWLFNFEKYSPDTAVAAKDLAGIIRSPAEAGYGLFLLLLMIFFFYLFSKISLNREMNPMWIKNLIIFSYSGFVFFANTYLLRIVFPLMARESEAAWYIFSLPVARVKILRAKILITFLAGLPLIFLSTGVWWSLKYVTPYQPVLTLSSLWTVLVLITILVFLGAIRPNFAEGLNPEKVSTSFMGITALVITSVITSVFSLSLYKYLNGEINPATLISAQLLMGVIPMVLLYFMSLHAVNKYEF